MQDGVGYGATPVSSCDEAFSALTELPQLQEAHRFVGLPVRLSCLGAVGSAPQLYLLAPFLEDGEPSQAAPRRRRGRRGRGGDDGGLLGQARGLCGCTVDALLDARAPTVLKVLESAPLIGPARNVVGELAAGLPRLTSCEAACRALEALLRRRREWPSETDRALWRALQRCVPDFDERLRERLRDAISRSETDSVAGSRT